MPSFQSPVPMSGRPWAPAVRPLSIARTQCSKSVPSSARHARLAVRTRARPARAAAPPGTATRSSSTPVSPVVRTYSATTYGSQSRSSEQRERRPRPLGSCHQCWTSPSTNCRPAARSECARARSGRASSERHHVLQLIAEAEGAARLVVAAARPQPAADVLIEQPPVHQHVERIVRRAHLDGARASGPTIACTSAERRGGRRPVPCRAIRPAHASRSVPWPSRNTSCRRSPGLEDARAPAAPRRDPAPRRTRPESAVLRSAAGATGRRCGR